MHYDLVERDGVRRLRPVGVFDAPAGHVEALVPPAGNIHSVAATGQRQDDLDPRLRRGHRAARVEHPPPLRRPRAAARRGLAAETFKPRRPACATMARMEQRISLITLGVADLRRAMDFYAGLGWEGRSPDGDVAFFQAGGMVFALWGRDKLAADSAVDGPGRLGRRRRSRTASARRRRSTPCSRRPRAAGGDDRRGPARRRPGAATRGSSSTRTATRGRSPTTRAGRSTTTGRSRSRPASAPGVRPAERDQLARHVRLVGVAGGQRGGRQRLAGAHAAERDAEADDARERLRAVADRGGEAAPQLALAEADRGRRARAPAWRARARAARRAARTAASGAASRSRGASAAARATGSSCSASARAAGRAPEVRERRRAGRAARRTGRRAPRRRRPGGSGRRRGPRRARSVPRPGACPVRRRTRARRRRSRRGRRRAGRASSSPRPVRVQRQRTTWASSGGGCELAVGHADNGCARAVSSARMSTRRERLDAILDAPRARRDRPARPGQPRLVPRRRARARGAGAPILRGDRRPRRRGAADVGDRGAAARGGGARPGAPPRARAAVVGAARRPADGPAGSDRPARRARPTSPPT